MAESLRKRGKPFHITKHNHDLPAFPFDLVSLSQDFFRKAPGKIPLDFRHLLVKREFVEDWL